MTPGESDRLADALPADAWTPLVRRAAVRGPDRAARSGR